MTIYIVRASHANIYELQNYLPLLKNHDIQVISSKTPLTPTPIPTTHLLSPTDIPFIPFRRPLLNRLVGGEQWLLGLSRIVNKTDILHTAETYTPYTHQAVQLRKNNLIKKLVCTCWETIPHNNEKYSILRQWKKEAYRYVDIFHVPTNRAKQALIIEGVSKAKIRVIPYTVDPTHFYPVDKNVKAKKRPTILTVARRVREKGYNLWLELKKELGTRANFVWVDSLSYQDLPAVYRSADIFYLPSQSSATWEEQYGMALIEAMQTGLPIVTTTSGAIPEVVADSAILIAEGSYLDHRRALLSMLNSPTLRQHYSDLSRKRAKNIYNQSTITKKLAELYIH